MKKITLTLIIFKFYTAFGQLKQIVVRYPHSQFVSEVYYVEGTDHKIKHGSYFSFYLGWMTVKSLRETREDDYKGIKERGGYESNLKEGLWTYYNPPKRLKNYSEYNELKEEGDFHHNEKVGVWNTYVEDGQVIKKYDYSNGKYLCAGLRIFFKYPLEARRNGIEGVVKIRTEFVNSEPTYKIVKDIGYGCGDAVVKMLNRKNYLMKKYRIDTCKNQLTNDTINVKFSLSE